jgi:hypothetical protein
MVVNKPRRIKPNLTPRGTITIKFEEEPSDDDWFALMNFLRTSTVYEGRHNSERPESGGYDITIIRAEERESAQTGCDLEREPVFFVLAGGVVPLFWDAEGHVMDNETANFDPDDED